MKKTLGILVLALLFSVNAFAAAATVTQTEYGYEITGGTSATVVSTGTIFARQIAFSGASIGNTAVLTSGSGNVSCMQFKAAAANDTPGNRMTFGVQTPFTNLTVTLSNGSDILYIYTY